MSNKSAEANLPSKSVEEFSIKLMEYKEELDISIREYEDAVKKMKQKDRIWTSVTLAILLLVGFVLYISIDGIKTLIEHPDTVRPILWASLGCLLLGFMVARLLAHWERHALFREEIMRYRREEAATRYANLIAHLEQIKTTNKNDN